MTANFSAVFPTAFTGNGRRPADILAVAAMHPVGLRMLTMFRCVGMRCSSLTRVELDSRAAFTSAELVSAHQCLRLQPYVGRRCHRLSRTVRTFQ
jgi:hypothetical protein